MKKILFVFACLVSLSICAQKGASQFSLFGGYEYFPELWNGNGYNVGIEFKHYVNNRIYAVANFHAGVNDGSGNTQLVIWGKPYDFNLSNHVNDYMLGFGLGGDLLQTGRHKIYVQATAGIGTSDWTKEDIVTIMSYNMIKPVEGQSTRFAISASAGYDYRLTDWLAVGINYTGWQIGYEYKNSVNLKLGLLF